MRSGELIHDLSTKLHDLYTDINGIAMYVGYEDDKLKPMIAKLENDSLRFVYGKIKELREGLSFKSECPECGGMSNIPDPIYCFNCGLKMNKE